MIKDQIHRKLVEFITDNENITNWLIQFRENLKSTQSDERLQKQSMFTDILLGISSNKILQDPTIDPLIFQVLSQRFDEALVFAELRQKIGLQDINPSSETYKDLMRYLKNLLVYSSSQKAQFHREANRLGKFDIQKQNIQLKGCADRANQLIKQIKNCQCCGLIKQQEELKICSNSFEQLVSVGISTYMFYRTMKNLIYLLILALIIFGIFAIGSNLRTSDVWNAKGQEISFSSSLKISLGSKIYLAIYDTSQQEQLLIIQVWLGLGMIIAFILGYVWMEKIEVKQVRMVENLNKSASDFTVVVTGLPLNVSKAEIASQIELIINSQGDGKKISQSNKKLRNNEVIAKISVGIPKNNDMINQDKSYQQRSDQVFTQLTSHKQKIISLIMQLCKGTQFETPTSTRQKIEKQFLQFRRNNKLCHNDLLIHLFNLSSKLNTQSLTKILRKSKLENDALNNAPSNQLIKSTEMTDQVLTDAFVTFESKKVKQKLVMMMENTVFDKFLKYLTLDLYQKRVPIKLNGRIYKVRIDQASQPQDIIWENIGMNPGSLLCRKCITFVITFVILGVSFVTIYGLSTVQYNNQENVYISFLISLCLSIFNFIILFILRILTFYELGLTQTDYQSSLAVKAIIAQLINTIIIPILVNRFLKNQNNMYQKSGLAEDVFLLGITNSFLGPILKIIDVNYFYMKYFRVWYNERTAKKFYLSQKQLNRIYQLVEFQNGIEYVYIITLYLFTCFFMSLQPVIILFAIAGYFLNYWAQSYCLFHRCKRPVPGTRILYDTMVQFIYAGGLFYSLGSLSFINLIPEDVFKNKINPAFIANLIAVGISAFSLFIPFSFLYELFFISGSNRQLEEEDRLFSQDRIFLLSQYDRMNPATSQTAVTEYIDFVNAKKMEFKKKSSSHNARILAILQKQARNCCSKRSESFKPLRFLNPSGHIGNQINGEEQIVPPNLIFNHLFSDLKAVNQQELQQNQQAHLPCDELATNDNLIFLKNVKNDEKQNFQTKKQQIAPFKQQSPLSVEIINGIIQQPQGQSPRNQ